ncbi:MAG: peptidoglycan DD-metalloendopeptidase family protein [Methylococcales bacterium]|nr:peptidoglycan DD-metalloendopeptidase family protein [Methylococcales bacterium]
MKLIRFLCFVFLVNSFFAASAIADNKETPEKNLTVLQKKIKTADKKVNQLKAKKKTLLAEQKKLDIQYGESSSQLKKLKRSVAKRKQEHTKNRKKIHQKQAEIDQLKDTLANQVKLAHGMGRHKKLKLMLSQKNAAISGRMFAYYDYFNQARQKEISTISNKVQSLKILEDSYRQETEDMSLKLKRIKQRRTALLKTQSEQKTLLTSINKLVSLKQQQLGKLRSSEDKIKILIEKIQPQPQLQLSKEPIRKTQEQIHKPQYKSSGKMRFGLLRGSLPWPVKGEIIKKFGEKRANDQWDGVLLNAKEGDDVHAVADGQVVYADWLRGYGLLIMIDHGQNYMTLYAFNQSLYKKSGDKVKVGDIVASVGSSGGQTEIGLYFGIRKKTKPINPVKWCRKK